MNLNNLIIRELITQFTDIKINYLSGNTIVEVESEPSRMFSFNAGKLMGISGGVDLVNCWQRNLEIAKLMSPGDLQIDRVSDIQIPVELYMFAQKLVVIEILFALIQIGECNQNKLSYQFIPIDPNHLTLYPNSTLLDIQPILDEAVQSWQAWQTAGLSQYCPNKALNILDYIQLLELIEIDNSLEILLSIDGKKSLRDLAVAARQNLLDYTIHLLPLLKEKVISLGETQQLIINNY